MSSIKKPQLKKIAKIISGAGFHRFLQQFNLVHLLPHWHLLFGKKRLSAVPSATLGRVLHKLGPGFVLAGQIAAARPDLVGEEYQEILRELDYSPAPLGSKDLQKFLRRELSCSTEKIFSHFEAEPVGRHLLGFTYRAILHNGKRALVTVNQPEEIKRLQQNLRQLRWLLDWILPRLDKNHAQSWLAIWEETARQANALADLTSVGGLMEIFSAHAERGRKFSIQEVIWDHTTAHVLMQRAHKLPTFSDILFGRSSGAGTKKYLVRRLLEFFVYQYGALGHFLLRPKLEDYQAAPGNRAVNNNYLGAAYLEPDLRRAFTAFLYCVLKRDSRAASRILLKLHYIFVHKKATHHPLLLLANHKSAAIGQELRYIISRAGAGGVALPLPFIQAVESVCFLEELVSSFDPEADFAYSLLSVLQGELPGILGTKKSAGIGEVLKQVISPAS